MSILARCHVVVLLCFLLAPIGYADSSLQPSYPVHDPVELSQAGFRADATNVYRKADGGYFELYGENDPQPQDFGVSGTNYYSIPAPLFLADEHDIDLDKNSAELSCNSLTGGAFFYAPVTLPSGARITRLEYFGRDAITANANVAQLRRACQQTNTALPVVDVLTPEIGTDLSFDSGNFYAASTMLNETVDNQSCVYHVGIRFVQGCSMGFVRAYKVRLQWQRQISPPPSSPTFLDVPASHPFFQSIEAMAASGITGGCGGGNYCPGDVVTRGEMAAFLTRALGL